MRIRLVGRTNENNLAILEKWMDGKPASAPLLLRSLSEFEGTRITFEDRAILQVLFSYMPLSEEDFCTPDLLKLAKDAGINTQEVSFSLRKWKELGVIDYVKKKSKKRQYYICKYPISTDGKFHFEKVKNICNSSNIKSLEKWNIHGTYQFSRLLGRIKMVGKTIIGPQDRAVLTALFWKILPHKGGECRSSLSGLAFEMGIHEEIVSESLCKWRDLEVIDWNKENKEDQIHNFYLLKFPIIAREQVYLENFEHFMNNTFYEFQECRLKQSLSLIKNADLGKDQRLTFFPFLIKYLGIDRKFLLTCLAVPDMEDIEQYH
jgi:transcription initiation factor IIE alpha subunit